MNLEYITLAEAANVSPGRPHANTVWRWCRRGVKCQNGERVHLQHIRAGRQLFTTEAWLQEFFEKLAKHDLEHFDAPRSVIPRQRVASAARQRQIARAEAALRKAGI